MMYGGNVPCEFINGQFVPKATTDAYLNITYNYGRYYYEAFRSKEDDEAEFAKNKAMFPTISEEGGIRSLNGMTGLQATPLLKEMIRRIERKYRREDGSWIETEREDRYAVDRVTGKRKDELLGEYFELRRAGLSDEEAGKRLDERYERRVDKIWVNEGSSGKDYWTATAANAIRPLHQLIALSQMCPDGVWSEES